MKIKQSGLTFTRKVRTELAATFQPEGFVVDFRLVIVNEGRGKDWTVTLEDWDCATGAIGIFSSQADAMAALDEFIPLAMQAYKEKHAKYGHMPTITRESDGTLQVKLEEF